MNQPAQAPAAAWLTSNRSRRQTPARAGSADACPATHGDHAEPIPSVSVGCNVDSLKTLRGSMLQDRKDKTQVLVEVAGSVIARFHDRGCRRRHRPFPRTCPQRHAERRRGAQGGSRDLAPHALRRQRVFLHPRYTAPLRHASPEAGTGRQERRRNARPERQGADPGTGSYRTGQRARWPGRVRVRPRRERETSPQDQLRRPVQALGLGVRDRHLCR